jgi:TatA/E family protein of Tat protein translocase
MNLGFSGEMIFLAALGLILFGPKKLPEIAKSVGRFVAELKRATNEFQGQLTREIGDVGDVDLGGTAKTLNSLVERIRAANVAPSADKAMMALVSPAPAQERFSGDKFLNNISRISGFLDSKPESGAASNAEEQGTQAPLPAETRGASEPSAQNVVTTNNGSGSQIKT